MELVKSLVITGYGINCQEETAYALSRAGSLPLIVHIDDLIGGAVLLTSFHLLVLPGGFSYGDHLGSGKALANRLCHASVRSGKRLIEEIRLFVAGGGHILGICNGFQVLVKSGLLPALGEGQEVTLTSNLSGIFEDRWVHLLVNRHSAGGAFSARERLFLPVRHGEGRFVASLQVLREMQRNNLILMQYTQGDGEVTEQYPGNPNGSRMSVAGICDVTGRVTGIMPHPEAFVHFENHPFWTRVAREKRERGEAVPEDGDGLRFFEALGEKIRRREREAITV